MKNLIGIFLVVIGCSTHCLAKEMEFTDVENHWARESIERMAINGYVQGYPDHTFRPEQIVTGIEFWKMLVDTFPLPLKEEGLVKWPESYETTAKVYGISIELNEELTRYEMIHILSHVIPIEKSKTNQNKLKDLQKEKESVAFFVKIKVINGYDDGTFRGDEKLTRAEAVVVLLRAKDYYLQAMSQQKGNLTSETSNIGWNEEWFSSHHIRYEIQNRKIYFWDKGRFSQIKNYTIEEKYVTNAKLLKLLETLVSPGTYTYVYYIPSSYTINQVMICFGENEKWIEQGLDYFSFTYYEDKRYDLHRIAMEEVFSKECYMKISIKKMWTELYEFQKGNVVDHRMKEALYQALKIEFGKEADDILSYMLEQYERSIAYPKNIAETKQFRAVKVNTYKTDATSLEFYFEKLSS